MIDPQGHALIIEQVSFQSHPDVNAAALQAESALFDRLLEKLEGFIQRFLARQDDGTWVEVVFWRDMASAEQALDIFLNDPATEKLRAMVDSDSVKITYSRLVE